MANEVGPVHIDSKTVTVAGTPEALTTREVLCSSVFLLPLSTNTDTVYVVDSETDAKTFPIPSGGVAVPINNPALIEIDAEVSGEGVTWMAS